jgi:hypothetical protein
VVGVTTWPKKTQPLRGGWVFSTSHAASSSGIPVLVAPTGEAFGPGDLLSVTDVAEMRGISQKTLSAYLSRGQASAGAGWERVGRNGGYAIRAAAAVRAAL